jgi:hypothetical protein
MKFFNVIVSIALVISVSMNVILSTKVENVEYQLMNISNHQQQILSAVEDQANHIRTVMEDIQKQQSWISAINVEMKPANSNNEEAIAKFNWQIKEQVSHSKVMFHYALDNDGTFTTVEAENLQNGLYQVSVPLSLQLEPHWEISTIVHEQEQTKSEMVEKKEIESKQKTLNYFVSVSNGNNVKSSEISNWYLGDYGVEKYGVINVNFDIMKESSSVLVTTYQTGLLEKVELLTYNNNRLVDQQKLKPEFEHYIIDKINIKKANQYVLKITYKNGENFEKEIY